MLHVLLAELCPVVVQPVTPHRHNLAPVVLISGSRLSGFLGEFITLRCVGCGGEHRTGRRRAPWPAPRPYCSFTIINIKKYVFTLWRILPALLQTAPAGPVPIILDTRVHAGAWPPWPGPAPPGGRLGCGRSRCTSPRTLTKSEGRGQQKWRVLSGK